MSVLSDVHVGSIKGDGSKAIMAGSFAFSSFFYKLVDDDGEADEGDDSDGDLIVKRVKKRRLTIRHYLGTNIEDVGFQVWNGALYMMDYLLTFFVSTMIKSNESSITTMVIDVGSGTGLTSLLLAQLLKEQRNDVKNVSIYATDYSNSILENIDFNIKNNKLVDCYTYAKYLDLFHFTNETEKAKEEEKDDEKIDEKFKCDLVKESLTFNQLFIIASDIIYGENLTFAFFDFLKAIKHPRMKVIVSIEKRINFSLSELKVEAVQYEIFKSRFCSKADCSCKNYAFHGRLIERGVITEKQFIPDSPAFLEIWELFRSI